MLLKIKCVSDGETNVLGLKEFLDNLNDFMDIGVDVHDDQKEIVLETYMSIQEFVSKFVDRLSEFCTLEDAFGEPETELYGLAELIQEYPLSVAPDDARKFLELYSKHCENLIEITEV